MFDLTNCGLNQQQIYSISQYINRNQIGYQTFIDLANVALDRIFNPPKIDTLKSECRKPQIELLQQEILQKLNKQLFLPELIDEIAEKLTKVSSGKTQAIQLQVASSETMGRRQEMEDVQCIISDFYQFRTKKQKDQQKEVVKRETLLCLFDGHGGRDCSEALSKKVPAFLADQINDLLQAAGLESPSQIPPEVFELLFTSLFVILDQQLKQEKVQAGSTAIVLYFIDNLLITANCGDSRAVLSRGLQMMRSKNLDLQNYKLVKKKIQQISDALSEISSPNLTDQNTQINLSYRQFQLLMSENELTQRLSKDHKPFLEDEKTRIQKEGGFVQNNRLMGIVSVSRSFGDFAYKPKMSVIPFVSYYQLTSKDAWVAVSCDGVWDVLSDLDCAMIMLSCQNPQAASIKIRDEAYRFESGDNISVICAKITEAVM